MEQNKRPQRSNKKRNIYKRLNETKLTLEKAENMKPWEWVHFFKPDWAIKECENLLLAKTAYPLITKEETIDKLNEIFNQNQK